MPAFYELFRKSKIGPTVMACRSFVYVQCSLFRLKKTLSDLSSEMLSTLKNSTFVRMWYQRMRRRPRTLLHQSHMTKSTQR